MKVLAAYMVLFYDSKIIFVIFCGIIFGYGRVEHQLTYTLQYIYDMRINITQRWRGKFSGQVYK